MWPRINLSTLGIACMFVAALFLLPTNSVDAAPARQSDPPVIAAAGNISDCAYDQDSLTAYLLDSIDGPVLTVGDAAYEVGSLRQYLDCYANTWGRHLDRTYPAPGNRDYGTQGAEGYYTYFGDRATPLDPGCTRDCKGYYSFDVGDWHIISLNSETPNTVGSEQEQWLRADLAANDSACTLAYWHRPRYSSSQPKKAAAHDLWNALYDYGADVVLSAHWHNYERFAPQDGNQQYDPEHGIRQFVVGTGGRHYRKFDFIQPNSEVRNSETWGVLKMTLHPDRYDWEYIPIPGQSFTDSGSSPCVSPANAPAPLPVSAESTVQKVSTGNSAASVSVPSTATGSAKVSADGTYVVKAGDTLFVIARDHGMTLDDIVSANGISNVDVIEIGDVLKVSGATSTSAAAPEPASAASATVANAAPTSSSISQAATPSSDVHIVGSGDTIFAIALANGVDWQKLLELNGLAEDSILQIDQEIKLQ